MSLYLISRIRFVFYTPDSLNSHNSCMRSYCQYHSLHSEDGKWEHKEENSLRSNIQKEIQVEFNPGNLTPGSRNLATTPLWTWVGGASNSTYLSFQCEEEILNILSEHALVNSSDCSVLYYFPISSHFLHSERCLVGVNKWPYVYKQLWGFAMNAGF